MDVVTIPMEHLIPAGFLGPEPVTAHVNAFLVPHPGGLVLVDTGMDPAGSNLDSALAQLGATWADISDLVITHAHPDHVGALAHVHERVPQITAWAGPAEGIPNTKELVDGTTIAGLTAVATPGHTAGHVSLLDDDHDVVLTGDCLGVMGGQLVRAPAQFTADPEEAERSLHRLLGLRGTRMLFSHGNEIAAPWSELEALLT